MRPTHLALLALLALPRFALAQRAATVPALPHYAHIFVILEENKGYDDIMNQPDTPNITRLAHTYGIASDYYGIVHPSEGNYVAMLGGDTFGIHDDDGYFCTPHNPSRYCRKSNRPFYANHTIQAESLMDQLTAHGLTWKAYYGALPRPGAMDVEYPATAENPQHLPQGLYASKHNGFMNFAEVQNSPDRAAHIVPLRQLAADIAANTLPNYAHIVPDQCDEMHGRAGPNVPPDCTYANKSGLIARGDRVTGRIVAQLMRGAAWRGPDNMAIVITFDEDAKNHPHQRQGCCGTVPGSLANFGAGRIATIVITNHGPRHEVDNTPYSHYSLLRTVEDAFGISRHLGHANAPGVVDMTPLFAGPSAP